MKTILFILALAFGLYGCSSGTENKKAPLKTYVVKAEPVHKTLYFTGTIQPLRISSLTCPIDSVMHLMHYYYGQQVKKGDLIFTLNSSELQKRYNDLLTDYLKAKDHYSMSQAKFRGTKDLWHSGLISKNNYLSELSSIATARVSLMQATMKLRELLQKMDDKNSENPSNLRITEFNKLRQALAENHQLIRLKSPNDGVLLYPPKKGDETSGKLSEGSLLKAGQVMALVGDLSGVRVEIDIPEVDIDKVHIGMPANITGIALGKQTLRGVVIAVNEQATTTTGSTLPSFTAMVEVKTLNDLQRPLVKVGMSASVEIIADQKEQLLIPINALKQLKGQSLVKVKEVGGFQNRVITTGPAQADKVVVASGLSVGDVVAYD